jgi:hypothetical protein
MFTPTVACTDVMHASTQLTRCQCLAAVRAALQTIGHRLALRGRALAFNQII